MATVGPGGDEREGGPTGIARAPGSAGGGPLTGLRIVEIAGLGAGPFCAMMLADMGADVVRIDRPGAPGDGGVLGRNRRAIEIDLKSESGPALLFELIRRADALIEAFRPGVAERLGFGPTACLGERPSLIHGRATGWGEVGPWRMMAGHDINYIALSGVLSMIGPKGGDPVPPLNLVGDFGGGGMVLAFGMVCALLEVRASGVGQVVDAAMAEWECPARHHVLRVDGPSPVDRGAGHQCPRRRCSLLRHLPDRGRKVGGARGRREPIWWAFVDLVGLDVSDLPDRGDRSSWPRLRERIAAAIATRTRDEWGELVSGTDTCLTPVLTPARSTTTPTTACGRVLSRWATRCSLPRAAVLPYGPQPADSGICRSDRRSGCAG